jgi:hypothetical protein
VSGSESIEFLLVPWVEGAMFNPAKADGLEFEIGGERQITLSLKPSKPDDDPFRHRHGLEYRVKGTFSMKPSDRAFVAALIDRRFLPFEEMPFQLPVVEGGVEEIDADGNILEGYSVLRSRYPPTLREVVTEAENLVTETAHHFLKLLIWSLEADAPPDCIKFPALYWRVSDGKYSHVGSREHGIRLMGSPGGGLRWDQHDRATIAQLWNSKRTNRSRTNF